LLEQAVEVAAADALHGGPPAQRDPLDGEATPTEALHGEYEPLPLPAKEAFPLQLFPGIPH